MFSGFDRRYEDDHGNGSNKSHVFQDKLFKCTAIQHLLQCMLAVEQ